MKTKKKILLKNLHSVEHVGHATYAETVLEWETCLFMRTLPVRLSNGLRIVT